MSLCVNCCGVISSGACVDCGIQYAERYAEPAREPPAEAAPEPDKAVAVAQVSPAPAQEPAKAGEGTPEPFKLSELAQEVGGEVKLPERKVALAERFSAFIAGAMSQFFSGLTCPHCGKRVEDE